MHFMAFLLKNINDSLMQYKLKMVLSNDNVLRIVPAKIKHEISDAADKPIKLNNSFATMIQMVQVSAWKVLGYFG